METANTIFRYLFFILIVTNALQFIIIIWLFKRRQRLIANSESEDESVYITLFQKSFDPVLLIKDDKFVDFNEAALKYLGYESKDDLYKKHPYEISPEFQSDGIHSKEKANNMLKVASEKGHHHFEWEHINKNGEILFVEVSLTVINIKGEEHVYVVWSDLAAKMKVETELRLAIEKAEESDRLKSAFLESISHEIRTPMNAIIGFAQLLNYEQNSKEDIIEFVNYINKSGNSLLLIIDNIIDVSSLKSGVMEIYESKVELNKLFEEIYETINIDSENKKLTVIVDNKLEVKNLVLATDGARLRKTLYQLINNSIKFTEKGIVKFGCFMSDNMLEFFVHDTGIGVSDDDKKFVFNLFRKGSFNGEKLYGGTGLGLSIAKASIESMGGKIWLTSEHGIGTQVHFTVPFKLYQS